jgi:hypothetical protein
MEITIGEKTFEATEEVCKVIHDFLDSKEKRDNKITIGEIYHLVSAYTGINDLSIEWRKHEICYARHLYSYLSRELTTESYKAIAVLVGGKDHTTIIHSCKTIKAELDTSEEVRTDIKVLTAAILFTKTIEKRKERVDEERIRRPIVRIPEPEKFVRPPAIYTNSSPYGIAKGING